MREPPANCDHSEVAGRNAERRFVFGAGCGLPQAQYLFGESTSGSLRGS
jgi:hypothetical protein